MRQSRLAAAVICLFWNAMVGADDAAKNVSLTEFKEPNFGVRFSHTAAFATSYNPHGGANRVAITYRGKLFGGLRIGPLPPPGRTEAFIETGKQYYQEKWGAKNVDYRLYETPGKYTFHQLKTEVKRQDTDYVLERFVYLRRDKTPTDEAKKVMHSLSGAFSFEFIYPKTDAALFGPEITTVINTFRIEDNP